MAKLTPLQQRFINEYLICWNATKAARLAGYQGNDNTLGVVGYENLRKPKIAIEIEKRLVEHTMSANEVLARLSAMAACDLGEFANVRSIIDLEKHPKSFLIKKVKTTVTRTKDGSVSMKVELEPHDAQTALEKIGRYHKLFTDKLEVTGWKAEILNLLYSGSITEKDIESELGPDLAQELFESTGLSYAGVKTLTIEGEAEPAKTRE